MDHYERRSSLLCDVCAVSPVDEVTKKDIIIRFCGINVPLRCVRLHLLPLCLAHEHNKIYSYNVCRQGSTFKVTWNVLLRAS